MSTVSLLAHSRAAFSEAKRLKNGHWRMEGLVAVLALGAAFVPVAPISALVALGALAAKLIARSWATSARSLLRLAERCRRYDFEQRTLGWPIPGQVHAELLLSFSSKLEKASADLSAGDEDYFAVRGPATTVRFAANLAESIFFTEKLMEMMARRRRAQLSGLLVVVILTLVGLALIEPMALLPSGLVAPVVLSGLRVLSAFASVLLAVDVYGELFAFKRGSDMARQLTSALQVATSPMIREEVLRILIEYNCLLADLPLVPDEVYQRNRDRLDRLWATVSVSLPISEKASS